PPGQTSTDPTLAPDHAINGIGAQPYYPGDDVVDWMCADGYAWGPGLASASRQEPFQELFQAFYNWAAPHNKPIMIGETGAMENNPGDKANWFKAMHTSVEQHYPLIRAFLYFDVVGATNSNYDWQIDTSPEALAARIRRSRLPLRGGACLRRRGRPPQRRSHGRPCRADTDRCGLLAGRLGRSGLDVWRRPQFQ